MHPRAEEFVECAREDHDLEVDAHEFPEGTKTAADAADALDCDVAQIASAIVFVADGEMVVVITSGANRVSESKLAGILGADDVRTGDPDEISERLGWSIGGVPPVCHEEAVPVYMDETLHEYETVWAAAGTPEAVFPIDPDRLEDVSGAAVVDVAE